MEGTDLEPLALSIAAKATMKPIREGERRVVNIRTAPYRPIPAPVAGSLSVLQLDNEQDLGVGFHLYRMAPGTWTEPHEHCCNEQFIVLEGELVDHDGMVYRTGDFVWLQAGTEHCSYAPNGCLLAVLVEKPGRSLSTTQPVR